MTMGETVVEFVLCRFRSGFKTKIPAINSEICRCEP